MHALSLLLVVSGLWVHSGALANDDAPACKPDEALGEKAEDCPWGGLARRLIADGRSGHPVVMRLKREAPELVAQLSADAKRAGWKALWGRSLNYDELAKGTIVEPAILQAIGAAAHQKILDGKVAHAGLEHTYGYLFSILKTPFGYKRARWVRGEIERGFGLPEGLLGPKPAAGTLFSNVTYFTGRIAFRGENAATAILMKGGAPESLSKFDYGSLSPRRLVEVVEPSAGRSVSLRTDIVPFKNGPGALLVYSIHDSADKGSKLVTAFPVDAKFAEGVFKPESLGNDQPVATRYNAFVEGVTGRALKGVRTEEHADARH